MLRRRICRGQIEVVLRREGKGYTVALRGRREVPELIVRYESQVVWEVTPKKVGAETFPYPFFQRFHRYLLTTFRSDELLESLKEIVEGVLREVEGEIWRSAPPVRMRAEVFTVPCARLSRQPDTPTVQISARVSVYAAVIFEPPEPTGDKFLLTLNFLSSPSVRRFKPLFLSTLKSRLREVLNPKTVAQNCRTFFKTEPHVKVKELRKGRKLTVVSVWNTEAGATETLSILKNIPSYLIEEHLSFLWDWSTTKVLSFLLTISTFLPDADEFRFFVADLAMKIGKDDEDNLPLPS